MRCSFLGNAAIAAPAIERSADPRSAKYLMNQFSGLREHALHLLDQRPIDDKSFNAVILEITNLLQLVQSAYPESFFVADRKARYVLTPSRQLQPQMNNPVISLLGPMRVSAIKFGVDDWIPLYAGFDGLPSFAAAPTLHNNQIILERNLTPSEACLQNIELSLAGTMKVSVSRPIFEPTPPPQRFDPGRLIRRPGSR